LIEEMQVTIAANRRPSLQEDDEKIEELGREKYGHTGVIAAGKGVGPITAFQSTKFAPSEQVRLDAKCFVVIWLFEREPLGLQPFEVSSQVFC